MNSKIIEYARRRNAWYRGKTLPRGALGKCACCRALRHLRHIPDGPGDICLNCYLYKDRCSVSGCDDVAVERSKCRKHFVSADDSITADIISWRIFSPLAKAQELEQVGKLWPRKFKKRGSK